MSSTVEEDYDTAMQRSEAERAKWCLEDENYLNLLDKDEQTELLRDILENTIYVGLLQPIDISEFITFDNCNEIAYLLGNENLDIAKALYNELAYWVRK